MELSRNNTKGSTDKKASLQISVTTIWQLVWLVLVIVVTLT